MDDIGPLLFVALRFLLAGVVVLPFALRELKRNGHTSYLACVRANRIGFLAVGLAFFLGITGQQIGLVGTTVTNAGFLTSLYVVMVPFIMVSVLRVPQPVIIWPAAALAWLGIYLLSDGGITGLHSSDLLIMFSALFWAMHVILTGRVGQASGLPITMATTQFFIASALGFAAYFLLLPTELGEDLPSAQQLIDALPEIIYTGVLASGIGFTLQAVAQRYTSESSAAVLLSSESLFAALMGAIFLGERLVTSAYVGCAMIFVAILMVELVPRKKLTKG